MRTGSLFSFVALCLFAFPRMSAARALLDAGADPDAEDRFGATSLNLAVWRGFEDVVKALLDLDPSKSSSSGVAGWGAAWRRPDPARFRPVGTEAANAAETGTSNYN